LIAPVAKADNESDPPLHTDVLPLIVEAGVATTFTFESTVLLAAQPAEFLPVTV
jgi:hypothetical protein